MTPFTIVAGPAVPLMLDNVDTDVIIRINRLTAFKRDELGPYAFEALRLDKDGNANMTCVLNEEPFRGAPILLAGRNFGCGSSREGAVWALGSCGVRCVIAESFGDIFFANCFQNGMLPLVMPRPELEGLAAQAAAGTPVTVDLEKCEVVFPDGKRHPFAVHAMKRAALIDGMDEISRTLGRSETIIAWQVNDRAARPWLWEPVAFDAN